MRAVDFCGIAAIIAREGLSTVRDRACECGGSAIDGCCSDGEDDISRVSDAEEKWRSLS